MTEAPQNVVCLVINGLRAASLGPYGATWGETPQIDRLATQSLVLDNALVDRPGLAGFYRAALGGLYALQPNAARLAPGGLFEMLARRGVHSVLVTDVADLAHYELTKHAADCIFTAREEDDSAEDELLEVADSVEETGLARLTGAASAQLEQLAGRGDPFCLWIHSRGMLGPWDAPLAFRNALAEADDPTPPTGAEVPHRLLESGGDPDEAFAASCCYQGQVTLVDLCVGLLLAQMSELRLDDSTLLVVIGGGGFPLGEHGRLGLVDDALYAESLHVPWLMRFPAGVSCLKRSPALVCPADLAATLARWFGGENTEESGGEWKLLGENDLARLLDDPDAAVRDRLCMISDGEQAIRTPGWFLRMPEEAPAELYVKPDDRCEANDVASRCESIVEQLAGAWEDFARFARGEADQLPPLAEELLITPS